MAEGSSLSEKLAAIKELQAQKAAQAIEIGAAHGEALKENEAREAMGEAQREDALRSELKVLESDFSMAEKESLDANTAIAEANQMLSDKDLDPELIEAVKAIIEEGNQNISRFSELNERRKNLASEIAALNENPNEQKSAPAPGSPEFTRRKGLVEEVREIMERKMAEDKELEKARSGMLLFEKYPPMTIEEARAKKGEIAKLDIRRNFSNINIMLESGLLTEDDIIGQLSEIADKSPDRCQTMLLGLPKNVIEKLKLNDHKNDEFMAKLARQNMEYVDNQKHGFTQAIGLFSLPKLYELNQSGAALAGFDRNFMQGGKWQAVRDAIVNSYDRGPDKGTLLLVMSGELPELMFDAVNLKWLDREQIMKWLKDSSDMQRGTDNEANTISKILELKQEGYISEEESMELLG